MKDTTWGILGLVGMGLLALFGIEAVKEGKDISIETPHGKLKTSDDNSNNSETHNGQVIEDAVYVVKE